MKAALDKRQFGPWALVTGASSGIGKEFAPSHRSLMFSTAPWLRTSHKRDSSGDSPTLQTISTSGSAQKLFTER